MKTLKTVQEAVGLNIKELYTIGMAKAISDEELFDAETNTYTGIYWQNKTARMFIISEQSFQSFPITV